jgi:hypothetical protein
MFAKKTCLALLPLLAFATGCDAYYDDFYTTAVTTVLPLNPKQTATFNADLPNAIEQVFATCNDPLEISPDTTALDLAGTCDSMSDLASSDAQIVWAGLATLDAIDVSAAFPASVVGAVTDIYHVDGVFPWPVQNCDVWMDFGDMTVQGIGLQGMAASWEMSPDGRPALRLHLEDDGTPFATGTIEGDVDCPNPLNELALQPNVPDGAASINVVNMDLDIWIDFTFSGSTITAIADADVQIGNLTITPALTQAVRDRVGSFREMVEDFGGVSLSDIETDVASAMSAELGDLETQMAAMLQSAVPTGQKICSISIVSGQLKLKTAKTTC